jgi:hypothetical protein
MQKIRSVGVLSVAKMFGIIHACIGLLVIPLGVFAGLAAMASGDKDAALGGAMFVVFGIFAPVFYGALGFLMGALMAWIYNVAAKRLGGIELELETVQIANPTLPSSIGQV